MAARGARLVPLVHHDAPRQAEVGQLGVHVRPRTQEHVEAELLGQVQEGAEVLARIVLAEIEAPLRGLVYAPGDVALHEREPEPAHRFERTAPARGRHPEVVQRARMQRHHAVAELAYRCASRVGQPPAEPMRRVQMAGGRP